jgi:hypothetical protein
MPAKKNPDEIVHLQVKPGEVVRLGEHAYGDRATLQVRRGDLDQVEGAYEEVNPERLPDVGERPAAA